MKLTDLIRGWERERFILACTVFLLSLPIAHAATPSEPGAALTLRVNRELIPGWYDVTYVTEAKAAVYAAFHRRFPHIEAVNSRGLILPGARTWEMVPMMQIAGGIAPDQLLMGLRQSQTYIDKRLLHPLDDYVEALAGVEITDGHRLTADEYVSRLRAGPGWHDVACRIPDRCWPLIRRARPDGDGHHVYFLPIELVYAGLVYDRAMFAEHADDGIEDRAPKDWEEMLRWAQSMTDPVRGRYGLHVWITHPVPMFANMVYAAGGRVVERNDAGRVVCTLDTDAAVEAGYFWARMRLEKIERRGKLVCRGIMRPSTARSSAVGVRSAMMHSYLSVNHIDLANDAYGIGPLPAGPSGMHAGEFNVLLGGIFSGLAHDKPRRDAVWQYMVFFTGPEAQRLKVDRYVEAGLGPRLPRDMIEAANTDGRYDSVLRRITPQIDDTYRIAREGGVPDVFGRNVSALHEKIRPTIESIWNHEGVRDAIDAGDAVTAKRIIRGILERGTVRINRTLLGHLTPAESRTRTTVSWTAIVLVVICFVVVLRFVFRAFTPEHERARGQWQLARYWRAYVLALPALALIATWMYWPMIKGTVIAFQNYGVLGDSRWVGIDNFASVLFDPQFWFALGVSLLYAVMFMVFGFCAPIALAFLLNEVPRGTIFFRTIYYLPAVLSGVVVIFLWKMFYAPSGLLNEVLNGLIWIINMLPGVALAPMTEDWLQNPRWALFMCLLPTVWAGMGPGCLIYLAALKTVPEELYDAADMDGAGIREKVFGVSVPVIKVLIMINFIGAMIGAVRGSGSFILAMTGGGPYTERGGVTEVVGLKLFYTTFGDLRFGVGAAMAWVIGSILLGFTVFQLKRLANVEFRTASS